MRALSNDEAKSKNQNLKKERWEAFSRCHQAEEQ